MSSNIQVAIRVRPLISREKNDKLKEQWEVNENSIYPIDVNTGKRYGDAYYFDHIFDSTCSNDDIYNTVVHPVVDKAMNGFNGTIFAYGQTSSGKTYTMMGNAKEDGLISKAVQNIFLAIEQSVNRKFLLRVSYMEIYNEKIHDLLDIKNTVKISEDYHGSVLVNVKEEVTDCAEKVYDMMKQGDKARRIGETHMNEKSSRSHVIFRIIIESSDINDTGLVNVAHLNLVDLAGSERATHTKATGQRLKEGVHINKSLSTLSLVMKQLSESQDFINFRDSKLTRILQSSLGGNALTTVICAVTPAALEETHSTLAFASRAKTVKNRPLLNEVITDEALINKYALEITKLKRQLEKANDNTTQQAQRIALLEKCMIYSKKTNNNKSRRKTWSAPTDCNRTLPVIYENDVSDPLSSDTNELITTPNIESEECPYDEILDGDNSAPSSIKKKLSHWTTPQGKPNIISGIPKQLHKNGQPDSKKLSPWTTPQGKPNITLRIPKQSNKNGQPDSKKPENIKWLTNSSDTDTPQCVLRERAEYYEHEFKSLKELTRQEKLLLTNEFNTEVETLKAELDRTKNELDCERKLRKDNENKFFEENKTLKINLEEMKKKNDELLKLTKKLQAENNTKNDCEFIAEMYKEKYKKREKELLDSLKEARDLVKSNTNNTDDEKHHVISSGLPTPSTMNEFLEKYKKQLNILKIQLETNQPMSSVQLLFSDLQKLNEELINNSSDCFEELQDLLNLYKFTFELISLLLVDNTQIHELETVKKQLQNRVAYFQNKEKTYELLVSKQDEEIKHLSENILQYMSELNNHKNEISRYKEVTKLDLSIQTELDYSTNTTMNANETLTAEVKQFSEQYDEYKHQAELKTKQIEELTQKISSYVKQLTDIQEMYDTEKNQNEMKNKQIEELTLQISESNCKLSDIEEINKTKIDNLKFEINSYNCTITEKEEQLAELNKLYESEKQLNSIKDQRLAELTTDIDVCNFNKNEMESSYIKQLSEIQEKYEKETQQNETNAKINNELTLQITASNLKLNEIVSSYEEKFVDIQKMYETEKEQNEVKSKRINELLSEIDSTNFKFLEMKRILSDIQIMYNDQKNTNEINSTRIDELILEINAAKSALHEIKQNDEKNLYSKTVDDLTLEIAVSNSKLKVVESSFAKQLSEIQEKYEIEKQENKAKTNAIDNLTLEVAAYNSKISEMEYSHDKQISEIQEKYEVEKQENEAKSKTINDLTLEVSVIHSKLNEMESSYIKQISDLQKKYEDQKEENEAKDQKNHELLLKIDSSSDISSYIEQLSNMQEKYELVIQENESKDKKIDEYIKQLSDVEEKYETERQENNIKSKRNDELIEEINVIKSKLLEIYRGEMVMKQLVDILEKHQRVSKDKEIDELTSEITTGNNLSEIESAYEETDKVFVNLTSYIQRLAVLLENIDFKQHQNENKEIDKLTAEITACKSQLTEMESSYTKKLSDIQEKYDSEKYQNELKDKIIEDLKSNIPDHSKFNEEKEEKISSFVKELSDIQELYETEKRHNEINIIKIEELTSHISQDKVKLTTVEEELQTYKAIVDENGSLEKIIEELKHKILQDDLDLHNYMLQIQEKENLLEAKDKQITELNSKIVDDSKEFSIIEKELETYKSNYLIYKDMFEAKEEEIKSVLQKLGTVEEELNDIKSNKFEENNIIESKNEEIKELSSKITHYLNELTSVTATMNKYEEDLIVQENLVHKKDTEIEELSANIMDYLNQLSSLEEKLDHYELEIKKYDRILQTKNEEIEELSSNIIDYLNQLSSTEEKVSKLEAALKSNDGFAEIKDNKIEELSSKIDDYMKQLSSNKETINSYETSIHDLEDLLKCKDREIKELSANIGNYITQLSENDEKLRKYEEDLKKQEEITSENKEIKDLLRSKDKTINELTSSINDCKINLTSVNNQMHVFASEIQAKAELIEAKNTEIKELSNEIDSNQKILSKYKSQLKVEQNQMILKDSEIRNLTLQLDDIKNNVSLQIGEINQLKSVINKQKEIINNKDFQITNVKEEINQRDKQLQVLYEKNSVKKINNCCQTDCCEEKKDIHLQSEIEDLKSKYNTTIREMAELNKKNNEYKKIVENVTEKANTRISSCNNIVAKLKQDKEQLKAQINYERTSNQTLQSQLLVLKEESENKCKCSNIDVVKLQTKINKLEEQNKKLVKIIEDYQEQLHTKSHEMTLCKKSLESLKQDNQRLQNITKELNDKLHETEKQLQSTRSNMQLLNKENEHYSESARLLEETLEDVKFELFELKNKEREKIKKEKRQSLHDSSRSLSSDEHISIGDENKPSFDTKKADETKKQRQPLLEKQVDEQRQKFIQLQTEYDKMRKQNEKLIDLCKIRKHKIDELEIKLKIYN